MIHDLSMFDILIAYTLGSWTFIFGVAIIIITVMLIFKWIPEWKKRWRKMDEWWK